MKETKSLNPFDFSRKVIRMTDSEMLKVQGGDTSGCSDTSCCDPPPGPNSGSSDPACDTCTASDSCNPDKGIGGGYVTMR